MGLELLQEAEVGRKGVWGLPGRAHHKSGPHLVADLLQGAQTVQPMAQGHLRGVQHGVMGGVCRLMAQQVAVRAGIKPELVDRSLAFPQREGDGAVRPVGLDGPYPLRDLVRGEAGVLSPLEHEGAKAPLIPPGAAVQDGVPLQAVAAHRGIAPANAAVEAVILADVGAFDETADVDGVPIPAAPLRLSPAEKERLVQGPAPCQQRPPLLPAQMMLLDQLFQQLIHWAAWNRWPCRSRRAACPPSRTAR